MAIFNSYVKLPEATYLSWVTMKNHSYYDDLSQSQLLLYRLYMMIVTHQDEKMITDSHNATEAWFMMVFFNWGKDPTILPR